MPTTPLPIWLDMTDEDACLGDCLCRILVKWKIWHVALLSLVIYGLVLTGYGLIVTYLYKQAGVRFVGIMDPDEVTLAFLTHWVYSPIVWCYYAWQPRLFAGVCRRMQNEKAIGRPTNRSGTPEFFYPASVRRKVIVTASIGVAVALGTGIYAGIYLPSCPNRIGCLDSPGNWIDLNPVFRDFIWTPLLALNIIMLIVIIIRQALIAWAFSRLFRSYALIPKLFHPDGCGGLAFVGNFALASMFIATFVGAWLALLTVHPALIGKTIVVDGVLWFYYIGFSLALPFFFVAPVWSVHRAMYDARDRVLKPLGIELHKELLQRGASTMQPLSSDALREQLTRVQLYDVLDKAYATVPFQRPRALGFLITAIAPLVLTTITLVVQITQAQSK
jgi:hypothetical protein